MITATSLPNHPNDKREAEATLDAISPKGGRPKAAALDNGFVSEANIAALEKRNIDPFIAAGHEPHHKREHAFFEQMPDPPPEDASPKVKMAYTVLARGKLRTEIGKAIYSLRMCIVEPVICIIKKVMRFRQFSLRGLTATAGEWCLVCLAFNLKGMHTLMIR